VADMGKGRKERKEGKEEEERWRNQHLK